MNSGMSEGRKFVVERASVRNASPLASNNRLTTYEVATTAINGPGPVTELGVVLEQAQTRLARSQQAACAPQVVFAGTLLLWSGSSSGSSCSSSSQPPPAGAGTPRQRPAAARQNDHVPAAEKPENPETGGGQALRCRGSFTVPEGRHWPPCPDGRTLSPETGEGRGRAIDEHTDGRGWQIG